ncbi:MAG: DUF1295 domain-containing protein [Rhodanobacteraceae bacterium]|nr:DUF1295 domain-containing protein [Rhodanobacteraceae bacterium]
MNLLADLVLIWLLAALAQTAGWYWQQQRRNAGIVDVIWAAGVGATAIVLALLGDGALWPRATLAVLGSFWGLRLALYLWRRVRSESEDGRYAYLRTIWGDGALRWFAFFQFQALLIVLFALPFAAVARNPLDGPRAGWILAIAVWLIAISGEAIADAQLRRFRTDPANRGRTCRAGLWRYSRHPNYFFEWLHWFAYVLLALGSPLAWLAWSGPLVMYAFLRWLSGIPFTEAQALRTRGDDYRDYQRRTSMLFPWFPRRS